MHKRSIPFLLFLACLALQWLGPARADSSTAGGFQEAPVSYPSSLERDELVVYIPGNMPVILLAPHGGTVMLDDMPVRTNAPGRDVATDRLARALADELTYTDANGIRRSPYLVINRLHRKFAEPNKSWQRNLEYGWVDSDGTPAGPHPRAESVHRAFHACADHAVRKVEKNHGAGMLLDLHGLAARRKVDMYGYLIRASDLYDRQDRNKPSTDEALSEAVRNRSTLRFAASRKRSPEEIASLVRGEESLASLADEAYKKLHPDLLDSDGNACGRPTTPSPRYPNPKAESAPCHDSPYFNGSYDIFAHSSRQPGVRVDAVQIELLADARNNKTLRTRYAKAMAVALRQFMTLHYELDIAPSVEQPVRE